MLEQFFQAHCATQIGVIHVHSIYTSVFVLIHAHELAELNHFIDWSRGLGTAQSVEPLEPLQWSQPNFDMAVRGGDLVQYAVDEGCDEAQAESTIRVCHLTNCHYPEEKADIRSPEAVYVSLAECSGDSCDDCCSVGSFLE